MTKSAKSSPRRNPKQPPKNRITCMDCDKRRMSYNGKENMCSDCFDNRMSDDIGNDQDFWLYGEAYGKY